MLFTINLFNFYSIHQQRIAYVFGKPSIGDIRKDRNEQKMNNTSFQYASLFPKCCNIMHFRLSLNKPLIIGVAMYGNQRTETFTGVKIKINSVLSRFNFLLNSFHTWPHLQIKKQNQHKQAQRDFLMFMFMKKNLYPDFFVIFMFSLYLILF